MINRYKNGISTIISSQNEESLIALSILSFLRLSDEVVVVDNGSEDKTVDVARDIEKSFPNVRVYDVPELKDLFENRQFGLERCEYRWIIRADSDYVCYTSGPYDALNLRNHLLNSKKVCLTELYTLPHPNLRGDFHHTVSAANPKGENSVLTKGDTRVYRRFPGMKFERLGRWEGVKVPRPRKLVKRTAWKQPVYMHCNIKSKLNVFYRSERTNWREIGDYEKYPTLKTYIEDVAVKQYGASSIYEAATVFEREKYLKYIEPYEARNRWPYPDLVNKAIELGAGYIIDYENGKPFRRYRGIPDTQKLVEYAQTFLR